MKSKKVLTESEFLKIADTEDSDLIDYVGLLRCEYTEEFANGLFMVFTQDKTDALPYCQFAINMSKILNDGK